MNRAFISTIGMIAIALGVCLTAVQRSRGEVVWPGRTWVTRAPTEVGMDPEKMAALADYAGGCGCVVRHGYMIYSWGSQMKRDYVYSAEKPWYSHFLWKALRWQRRTILRCYQRLPSGRWEGPVDLTPEFTIDEYRSLAGFSVPPYAPSNFVPLVWSDHDEGTVKLLKVPVPLTLPKDRKTDK